jgi:hypothetical protein
MNHSGDNEATSLLAGPQGVRNVKFSTKIRKKSPYIIEIVCATTKTRTYGSLFTNMRFTRSHTPVRLRADYPLVQVQPVLRHSYSNDTLDRMDITPGPSGLTTEHWEAYQASIVEPNSRPNRSFGAYAKSARKARHQCMREQDATAQQPRG